VQVIPPPAANKAFLKQMGTTVLTCACGQTFRISDVNAELLRRNGKQILCPKCSHAQVLANLAALAAESETEAK